MSGKVSGRSDSLTTFSASGSCLPETNSNFQNDFGRSTNGIDEDRFRLFESLCMAPPMKVHNLKDIPLPTIGRAI